MTYQARIYNDVYKEDYKDGESEQVNSWTETLTAKTKDELKEQIEFATNSDWKNIEQNDANEYDHATEYWSGYSANANNYPASESEIAEWKKGKKELYSVHCHILVSEVKESKVTL